MRDIMQSALQRPDLSVWERTYLPTTSSKIKALLNGKYGVTSFASKTSEVGGMVFLETNWSDLHQRRTAASSSHPEELWSSLLDMQTSSSEMLCPYSISVLMEQPERLVHIHEETTDGSICAEWLPTPSISDTTLGRMVFGSLRRIISWIASTIRRTTN
nr:MAG TPA: hypothetical protein [Caudoviricetes sp.]